MSETSQEPSTSDQQKLYLPKHCIVPLEARLNYKLSDSSKIYLGELSVLTNMYGYCWASDEDLSKMKGVSTRTIQNWHKELETYGFIKRETWKEHYTEEGKAGVRIRTKRKIFIIDEPSKNVSEAHISAPRSDPHISAPRSDPQKCAGISSKPLNTEDKQQQQQEPAAAVFSCLKNLEIPQDEKEWITKNYTEAHVEHSVEYVTHPSTIIKESLLQALKWSCNKSRDTNCREPQIKKTATAAKQTNSEYIKKNISLNGTKSGEWDIIVGTDYIEFVHGNCCKNFNINEKDFIEKVREMDKKCRK